MELDCLDDDFLEQATKNVRAAGKFRPKSKFGPKSANKPSQSATVQPQNEDGKNVRTENTSSDGRNDVGQMPLEVTFDVKSGSSQLKRCELLRANRENSSKEVKLSSAGGDDLFPSTQSIGMDFDSLPPASQVEVLSEQSVGSTFSLKAVINEPCDPSTTSMPASHDGIVLVDEYMDDEHLRKQDGTTYYGLNSLHSNAYGQDLISDNGVGEFGAEMRNSVSTEKGSASLLNESEPASPSKASELNFLQTEGFEEDLRQFSPNATVDVWQSYDPSVIDNSNVLEMQGSEPLLDKSHSEMPSVSNEVSETVPESNRSTSSNRQNRRVTFEGIDRECDTGAETSIPLVEGEQLHATNEVLGMLEENASCELPGKTRKRGTSVGIIDECENMGNKNTDVIEEDRDNDNDDDSDINKQKKTTKKQRAPTTDNDKQGRGHKKPGSGSSSVNNEQLKNKFSHSTRRSQKIDPRIKELFEMPEEDIDPQKLIIKDLISLAKMKEKKRVREAAASKKSSTNKSSGDSYNGDSPYSEDDNYLQTEGQNSDDDNHIHEEQHSEPSRPKLNYHSFMVKMPRERWSASQTQLFYEAVRQFGSDFAMIQHMFPGRTRQQIKSKYKSEEKKQPNQMADALMHRPKDHSHFELVLERVKAAQAERECNAWSDSPVPDGEDEEGEDNRDGGTETTVIGEHDQATEETKVAGDLENDVRSPGKEDEKAYDWNDYASFDTYYPDPKETLHS